MRWGMVENQLHRLEVEERRRAGTVQTDRYAFTLSCTCPPSTSIHFRGGLAWWPLYASYPAGFYIPSYTVDLSDTDKIDAGNFIFTNAGWYRGCLVGVDQSDVWPPPAPPDTWPEEPIDDLIYLRRTFDEYETAAEAEIGAREIIGDNAAYYSLVMGCIVLRNNGDTTNYNQFMPIDPVNRGRSYLFGGNRYGWELG